MGPMIEASRAQYQQWWQGQKIPGRAGAAPLGKQRDIPQQGHWAPMAWASWGHRRHQEQDQPQATEVRFPPRALAVSWCP